MPTYPGSLPQYCIEKTYSETPPDNLYRFQADIGPDKTRKKSSSNPRPWQGVMLMTKTQAAALDAFYVNDCDYGSLSFDGLPHQRTEAAVDQKFQSQPEYSHAGWSSTQNEEMYNVRLDMVIMP